MQWNDEAIVLSTRQHGETAVIVELLTRDHGRLATLVYGGRSRRIRPILQMGNHVDVVWKARLSEHLGHASVELRRSYAAEAMEDPARLAALSSLATLAGFLPERDPHPNLFEISLFVLSFLDDESVWPALYAKWELAYLDELGFGLDLEVCAATGANDDLIYVSPRSGRAVSASAGEPYKDRLFSLPSFLRSGRSGGATMAEVSAALKLTKYFIVQRVLNMHEKEIPDSRERLTAILDRRMGQIT